MVDIPDKSSAKTRHSVLENEDSKRYYDHIRESHVTKVYSGDCYVSTEPDEMMVTILGSCISACIRDPLMKVGGMNHFLLPDGKDAASSPMRYGAYAMEKLINDILKKGGSKTRLEVKVFGGGNVIKSSAKIGDKNVDFIKSYLKGEGLQIVQSDLGGTSPRRIHYYPYTGKVMMRKLNKKEEIESVEREEVEYSKRIVSSIQKQEEGDVELF